MSEEYEKYVALVEALQSPPTEAERKNRKLTGSLIDLDPVVSDKLVVIAEGKEVKARYIGWVSEAGHNTPYHVHRVKVRFIDAQGLLEDMTFHIHPDRILSHHPEERRVMTP